MSDEQPVKTQLPSVDEREVAWLAPFAMFSSACRGRKHAEDEHSYRGPFQRDRDRILHSSAFRRLSGKMQVFTDDMGDYHRTRLTHTHEVASIARTMGRALKLNEDLIEALALFHDIGHPPYGHAGEEALDRCLRDEGGFSHNQYALTIAEALEQRYHRFPGLNLTLEVLAGQTDRIDKSAGDLSPLLEVQIVDAADSITYDAHDTDDAVKLGLVSMDQLQEIPLIAESMERVRAWPEQFSAPLLRKAVVHELIDRQVGDFLRTTMETLDAADFRSAAQLSAARYRAAPGPLIQQSKRVLEEFLYEHVYRHPRLVRMRRSAQDRLERLFDFFCDHAEQLPPKFALRIDRVGKPRAVVEYLAGMTDRYCEIQCRELGIVRVVG